MSVTAYIGVVAAFCTTVAFVPQIVKLRKQGGKDLSYPMLFLYLTGVLLWLVYGVRVHATAVVWANALSGVLVLVSASLFCAAADLPVLLVGFLIPSALVTDRRRSRNS